MKRWLGRVNSGAHITEILSGSGGFRGQEGQQVWDADSCVEQRDHLLGGYADLLPVPHKLFDRLFQQAYVP